MQRDSTPTSERTWRDLYLAALFEADSARLPERIAEAEQALAEADGEDLDPHSQPFGNGIMAKFMDQDHESEDDDDGDQRDQKVRHD